MGGTLWIPNVIYDERSRTFIMWYGSGGWSTATSADGVHFTPAHTGFSSRFGPKAGTDGTGIFIDDDGTGYVAFASNPPGFDEPGHRTWPGHAAHGTATSTLFWTISHAFPSLVTPPPHTHAHTNTHTHIHARTHAHTHTHIHIHIPCDMFYAVPRLGTLAGSYYGV